MPRQIDRAALDALALRAVSREELKRLGYVPTCKSQELMRLGYSVVFWLIPGTPGSELLEFKPYHTHAKKSDLPRVTVACYEDQASLHRALGLGVVGRGEPWRKGRDESPGLFDSQNV